MNQDNLPVTRTPSSSLSNHLILFALYLFSQVLLLLSHLHLIPQLKFYGCFTPIEWIEYFAQIISISQPTLTLKCLTRRLGHLFFSLKKKPKKSLSLCLLTGCIIAMPVDSLFKLTKDDQKCKCLPCPLLIVCCLFLWNWTVFVSSSLVLAMQARKKRTKPRKQGKKWVFASNFLLRCVLFT